MYDSAIEEKVARATLAAEEAADALEAHGARSMLVVHLDSLFQWHAGGVHKGLMLTMSENIRISFSSSMRSNFLVAANYLRNAYKTQLAGERRKEDIGKINRIHNTQDTHA